MANGMMKENGGAFRGTRAGCLTVSGYFQSSSRLLPLSPPYKTQHIGSLLRPAALCQTRKLFHDNKCTLHDLQLAEDDAIRHLIKLQQDLGIKTITDGECRRAYFFQGPFETLQGMTHIPNRPIATFKPYVPHIAAMYAAGLQCAETVYCTGKIKRNKPFYTKQFEFTKSVVPPEVDVKFIKVTMCSPSWFHQRHGSDMTYDKSVYSNDDEYFNDLATAYREEIQDLYALGCRHIQFDDPTFAFFCSEAMIFGMTKAAIDHEALLDTYIRAINLCVKDRPADLAVGVHVCRGNFAGGVYFSEGGYDRIAVKLFNNLNVDTYYLEYDTERAGDFTPLKHLPPDKAVVLGLVTTKSSKMETIEELTARVDKAADTISQGYPLRSKADALNQICISTQCGFASVWEGNPITEEDERKKLALLIETANRIWKE